MLSVIVPVDLERRPIDLIRKIKLLVDHQAASRLKFVFAHNSRGRWFDSLLVKILSNRENVKLISKSFYEGDVNNSLLRNQAVLHASSPVLMLLDADLVPDQELFLKCAELINSGKRRMVILPCLYLSAYGSRILIRKKENTKNLFKRFLDFDRAPFLHLASPSSVTFLAREDYWRVGGFDERFVGHGYEDFDFILRLGFELGLIKCKKDILQDAVCRSPLLASGFRKYLGSLSLPHFLDHQVVFHLFHGKNRHEKYYKSRVPNKELFNNKHSSLILERKSEDGSLLVNQFFSICKEKNLDIQKYSILFDNRPGHVDRILPFYKRAWLIFTGKV